MNKSQLINFLTSLSEKEAYYKKNPNHVSSFYDKLEKRNIKTFGEVYSFSFDAEKEKQDNNKDITNLSQSVQFQISRQTRFSNVPLHVHDFVEMNIMYSGEATALILEKEIKFKKGNVCILDTNVPHTIKPLGEQDILINLIIQKKYFDTTMLSRLSNNGIISNFLLDAISNTQKHDKYIIFDCQNSNLLLNLVENLLCEYYNPSFCIKDTIDSYMILIFIELLKSHQENETSSYKSSNKIYIGEILQFIEKNYSNCTLESVSKEFLFHPNYLSRYIKQGTGLTFKEIIQKQRLNKACSLLKNSDLTINEICECIGYKNETFFYKKFKEHFNSTPKEYRDSNLSN
ncbi:MULTISPECIES: AraC family transcriptional regulator [unclassified Clostridioides]|uniref:AraC family transcriptional regulator n=1 Tax=unclassified Clostridioides TaxID=2635829 RepID=UPI001D10DF53|nr:AraC family transcriptional regulator [Clostridioides sp. ES-S-0171-01]UDN55183.1 helix-turn-helix domain-containing protein [Clostridioides sp. ES-S-0054-01]